MSELFVIDDMFNTLIALEEYGAEMYSKFAETTNDIEAQRLFKELAEQELEHKGYYTNLRKKIEAHESVDSEYQAYLNSLIKNSFLKNVSKDSIYTLERALELAIQLEKETILFLGETKQVLADDMDSIFNEIINEERRHLGMLYSFKEEKGIQ